MQILTNPDNEGINFILSDNQLLIRDMVHDFAEKHILPNVMEWDESQTFPVDVFKKLGESY